MNQLSGEPRGLQVGYYRAWEYPDRHVMGQAVERAGGRFNPRRRVWEVYVGIPNRLGLPILRVGL